MSESQKSQYACYTCLFFETAFPQCHAERKTSSGSQVQQLTLFGGTFEREASPGVKWLQMQACLHWYCDQVSVRVMSSVEVSSQAVGVVSTERDFEKHQHAESQRGEDCRLKYSASGRFITAVYVQ